MREEEEVWTHANQKEKAHKKRAKALSMLLKQQMTEPYLGEQLFVCEG